MFLSASSIQPFQDENADNVSFKKSGLLKNTSVQFRTPFKDRSVNSISPSSKFNRQVIQKKDDQGVSQKGVINDNCVILEESEARNEEDDIFLNDYASFKEIPDGFEDIYPSARLDIYSLLNEYVSGKSPKYIYDDEDIDNIMEIPVAEREIPKLEAICPAFSSTFGAIDVPLPTFNF
ncbi:hypothetical protein WA026_015915 [Henosepilachna vigintioctopunctata]|uniref:Uncharacterized protein n=1 Tax=Henosepilachna vigintioctopunctata TaxID=420089 RepID=A0AAW1U8B2_9CUCU